MACLCASSSSPGNARLFLCDLVAIGTLLLLLLSSMSRAETAGRPADEVDFLSAAVASGDRAEDPMERRLPLVISTWAFKEAARVAWSVVNEGGSSLDAVTEGCSTCERLRCDLSVGYGGSPDERGETTLDAMIMDGTTMNVGAVGALRSVKDAIRAAKLVLDYSEHSLLVGDQASKFAISLGFSGPVNLSTEESLEIWSSWRDLDCQPNYRRNVMPDPATSCGPYQVLPSTSRKADETCRSGEHEQSFGRVGFSNHDTISMAVIDKEGKIAVGTSTNGASHKIPGRVADGPIAGAAAYADDDVGACGATGDGDVMMRFLPCYQVVESMRQGMSPKDAAADAIKRIEQKYPKFVGAVFAVNRDGQHAGATHGWTFQYVVQEYGMTDVEVHTVNSNE